MKKAAFFILEWVGLLFSILGIVSLLSSAGAFQYRQRPFSGYISLDQDFAALIQRPQDRPLFELLFRADLDHLMGQEDAALRDLSQAIQEYPDFVTTHYYRGILYLSQGAVEAGIADLQEVVARASSDELRQRARHEILLAQIAQVATLVAYLGCVVFIALFLLERLGVHVANWGLVVTLPLLAFCGVWLGAFVFLLVH